MKHVKIIGVLAVAAIMMAFAANASAAKLTSPTGTEYATGSTIKATAGTTKLTGAFVTVECGSSTVEGTISSQGTGVPVKGSISTLDFNSCNFTTTVKKAGSLELSAIGTGNEVNGTLKSTGAEVEITTSLGSCVFTTNGTDVGTFTGGKTASMDISGVIPRTAGNFLCGSSGTWEGSYSVVTPDELWLDS